MESLQRTPWEGWETVREIGSGSYGTVYEIQRSLINGQTESAAMKVMNLPKKNSEIDRLYRSGYTKENIAKNYKQSCMNITEEYSLMRKLDGSANVVNCKDIYYVPHEDDIGWDIFIRMELLTPLEDVLTDNIPEETVLRLGIDICKALELCRKHNIVHRDIKPQNIFISPNGDYKLGDFGIAREMEATEKGTAIGTFNYMAPEVFFGQPYGSRADIYSLGIVLYWMLNNRVVPFAEKSATGVGMQNTESARKRRMAGEAFPPPARGNAALQRIVLKACAFNPQDRYESATQMREELEKLILDQMDVPDAYKNYEKYGKQSKKQPDHRQQTADRERYSEEKKGKSSKIIIAAVLAVALLGGGILLASKWKDLTDEPSLPLPEHEVQIVSPATTQAAQTTQAQDEDATEQNKVLPDIYTDGIAAFADVDDDYDGEPLNMRSGPGRDYDLITEVPDESGVTIIGYSETIDDWIYVGYRNYKGWILSRYVTPQTSQSEQTSAAQQDFGASQEGIVSDDTPAGAGLNVRSEPAYAATLLTTLSEGKKLYYYPDSATNGYVYCEFAAGSDGIDAGWVLQKYVTERDAGNTSSQYENATAFVSAQASSELAPYQQYTYSASNVLKKDSSCWCENSKTDGTGEWIILRLPEKQNVLGLRFINGYAGTQEQYDNNAKASRIRIEFSDGQYTTTTLRVYDTENRNTMQAVEFSQAVATEYVKIIIESVEDGDRQDMCLTYIEVY